MRRLAAAAIADSRGGSATTSFAKDHAMFDRSWTANNNLGAIAASEIALSKGPLLMRRVA